MNTKKLINQTEIGSMFDMSAIKVGYELVKLGLKVNKVATDKALDDKIALPVTLKNKQKFYLWNNKKICKIFSKIHEKKPSVKYWTDIVLEILEEADELIETGQDKIGYIVQDSAYNEVPIEILEQVKAIIESNSN